MKQYSTDFLPLKRMFATILIMLRIVYHMQCYIAMLVHIEFRTSRRGQETTWGGDKKEKSKERKREIYNERTIKQPFLRKVSMSSVDLHLVWQGVIDFITSTL